MAALTPVLRETLEEVSSVLAHLHGLGRASVRADHVILARGGASRCRSVSVPAMHARLARLDSLGLICQVKPGEYDLTDEGRRTAAETAGKHGAGGDGGRMSP